MKIKKLVSALLIVSVVACGATIANASGIEVYVDNVKTALSDGTGGTAEPFIQDGTTYVPLRGVSEALGCQVEWDGNNRTVKIYQNKPSSGSVFRNSGDDIMVYIDDEQVELKDANGGTVKPFIIDGTTFIPLRGISQALGCQVEWDGSLQRVSIYQNMVSPNGATLSEVKPYKLDGVKSYYESNGEIIDIDGMLYSNALIFWHSSCTANTSFNLNGKYNNMTFILAHNQETNFEKTITFTVDGKIINTYVIKPNEAAKEITVDLNNGLQLKVTSSNNVGMGNIVFH